MALGAAELYRATGNPAYLADARMYAAALGSSASFYWGNVSMLAQYEIARLDASYRPSATRFMEEDLTGNSSYRAIALAQRDYLLGANPWGVCFVNSVGTTWPHNPHHRVANLT